MAPRSSRPSRFTGAGGTLKGCAVLARDVYGVVACTPCRAPWLVELRHSTSTCPRCGHRVELSRRRRLWQGDSLAEAKAAVAAHRAAMAQGTDLPSAAAAVAAPQPLVRHDDPVDAAAAQARRERNASHRADLLAVWLTRLLGEADHDTYLTAMGRAGIPAARREKEITRMLATDVIYEPRAGRYRTLED